MKSSYYTGYEDLDTKLARLYEEQIKLEAKLRKYPISSILTNNPEAKKIQDQFNCVIQKQDALLECGKMRDNKMRDKDA